MSGENQKTILLVEDEVIIAKTEKKTLQKYGYKIITANTGEEAVETVKKTPAIDLILMDINLGGGIDGTEAAEIILRQRDIPVVFLSSHTEPEIVEKTEKITSYGYVVKNSSNTVLQASIKMAFKLFEAKTKEKEKEKTLHESEARYRAFFNTSRDCAYITSVAGRWLFMNDAAVELFGYSNREELSQVNIPDLYVHPEERAKCISASMENNYIKEFPVDLRRKDGTVIHALITEVPRYDADGNLLGFQGTIRDITERKRVESQREAALAAMRESEERYRTLVENASDIVLRTDENGYFTFVNPVGLRIAGYEEGEVIGKHYSELIHPDMRDQTIRHFGRQFIRGIQNTYSEYPLLTKDSHIVWIGQNTQLIVKDGHTTGFQAVARDITERKLADEEIKRQLAEKEILLREVHHRIRNNIASIGGLISLHVKSVTNPEAIAVLQDAIGRVNSMRILYDKLLFSEGYKDISVKNYLDDLIDTIIAIFPNHAKIILEKRIADFHLNAKQLFPLGIIINELLTNIMKYAFINRDTGLIKISLTNVAKHVTLTIQDNGNGLPAGFDIIESKGLGLMLVKMLNQQLGGSFSIENHAGTRCIFEFNI